jgi:DNA mismatch repair ATPase MutS
MTLPLVRLRASMRIDDSLQRGASYFHAELSRLRTVVAELGQGEPVLFLLDELLRGTNAHARQKGARAVILHLLKFGALGVVATHDIGLSDLADELAGKARNVHFTDVFEAGEMRFDYTLREGVVKTSNALRLLSMAGIDVEVDDALR